MSNEQLWIRSLDPNSREDINFVTSAFVRETHNLLQNRIVPKKVYYKRATIQLNNLLNRGARVFVAVLANDPSVYLGWVLYEVVGEHVVVHYSYVKKALRKQGVATQLIEKLNIDTSERPVEILTTFASTSTLQMIDKVKLVGVPDLFDGLV
jgi:predicted GNAT family acetyltransferase